MAYYGSQVGDKTKIVHGPCRTFLKLFGQGSFTEIGFTTKAGAKLSYTATKQPIETSDRGAPVGHMDDTEEAHLTFELMECTASQLWLVLGGHAAISGNVVTFGSLGHLTAAVYVEGMSASGANLRDQIGLYQATRVGPTEMMLAKAQVRSITGIDFAAEADTTKNPASNQGDMGWFRFGVAPGTSPLS